jgi:RHS repeat-associated protein
MKVLSPGNVDMVDGKYAHDITDLSVGPDGDSLDFVRVDRNRIVWNSNWHYYVHRDSVTGGYNYSIFNSAVAKTWYNPNLTTTFQDTSLDFTGSSKLEQIGSGASQYFKFTGPDGAIIQFEPGSTDIDRYAQSLTRPDGLLVQFQYDSGGTGGTKRLRRIYDNRGYIFVLEYSIAGNADAISKVCSINAAFTTPPSANTCPAGVRTVTYTYTANWVSSVMDPAGKVATVTVTRDANGNRIGETYYKPGLAQPYLTVTYDNVGIISLKKPVTQQVFGDGPTYTYSYDVYGSDYPNTEGRGGGWSETQGLDYGTLTWGTIQIDPQQHPAVTPMPISVDSAATGPLTYTLNPTWTRIATKTLPSGLLTKYTYGGGSGAALSELRFIPPSGSSDPQIASSYTYPGGCTNMVICDKPLTATDPRGNTTDYTYDPMHGGVLTETQPAPTAGAVRPQKRYTYQQFYARYRNSSGTVVQAPMPIWKLTQISECQTTASCAGTADEVRTTFTYPSGTGAFNLIPISKAVGAGDSSLTATTAWTYDSNGDKLTEDGPLAVTADTTRWRYDVMRRVIGVIGPDPDGAGALKYRAVRNTYDDAGRLTIVERGTVNSQSDPDWAAFAALERDTNSYDLQDRLLKTIKSGKSGTSWIDANVTQMKYDAIGQLLCRAVRMDPAQWSGQTDACVPQATGPNGPDRITRYTYDTRHRVAKKEVAVGTTDAADDETNSWTADSKLASVKDGENNLTTYEYDGHDRLVKTRFPVATKGAGVSSTTDYEQLTLDLASNVTAKRLRDGQTINYTYDNLNRVTLKDLPSDDPDVTIGYDNLGRTTSMSQLGYSMTFGYDALSRQTAENQGFGSMSRLFDLAGRMTRTGWWDGFYVDYDRLVTGEISKIRENGASTGVGVLATYAYDDQGRRTSVTFGNGASQAFTYDQVSRLASLTNDLSGTANDLSATFTHNPASQIASTTRTGDAYAFTGLANQTTSSTANGLNQQVTIGGGSASWDARGNLTTEPTTGKTYTYWASNTMRSASGGVTLYYDPLLRLTEYDTTSSTRFVHDGTQIAAEVENPAGAILKRYVWADGPDEPVVLYSGSGTTNRNFVSTDERGSTISLTDSAGVIVVINKYDEFGAPAPGNIGRFQYTGQAWLTEAAVYDYKARNYLPQLGIFAQTDPTGYDDGPNWYVYVHEDPIDSDDPTGTDAREAFLIATGIVAAQPDDPKKATQEKLNDPRLGSSLAGKLAIGAAALAVDDATGVGIADDPLIPVVLGGAAVAMAIEKGPALWDKMAREINGVLDRNLRQEGEQYALVASRSGVYPTVRGGMVHLNAGDVYKYGETTAGVGRYSRAALLRANLTYQVQYRGSQTAAKIREKIQIYKYFDQHLTLPPGNRIFR